MLLKSQLLLKTFFNYIRQLYNVLNKILSMQIECKCFMLKKYYVFSSEELLSVKGKDLTYSKNRKFAYEEIIHLTEVHLYFHSVNEI